MVGTIVDYVHPVRWLSVLEIQSCVGQIMRQLCVFHINLIGCGEHQNGCWSHTEMTLCIFDARLWYSDMEIALCVFDAILWYSDIEIALCVFDASLWYSDTEIALCVFDARLRY